MKLGCQLYYQPKLSIVIVKWMVLMRVVQMDKKQAEGWD
jgi:hypothetical protein